MFGNGTEVRIAKRLAGDGRHPAETPPTTITLGLDPAFDTGLAAEIDAALSLGIAGVRDDHAH